MNLKNEKCKPCEGGISALTNSQVSLFKTQIHPSWQLVNNHHLTKDFAFVNFKNTMNFVNKIAALAEEEGHHPVMHVFYAKVVVEIWTHAIDGMSENDFILAAKIDSL